MTDTKTVKISIVVPCSGSTSRECVDRILKYTTFENKELIIVANGCEPGTVMYFQTSLPKTVTVINLGEKKGQIMPVINGYKCMKGEFLVLIDDDTVLLEQPMNNWIDRLYDPFKNDPKVGISGPFSGDYPYLGRFLHSGCTMYSKKILDEVGGFDEGYGFGYLYDVDVSAAIQKKYIAAHIGDDGTFPIYHPASPVSTETKKEQVRLMRQNRERLYRKHSKKPRFSIIIPTYNHLDDCLRPCLESLKQYTVLDDIEVLVVANGCKDGTADFVDSLGYPFKLVWFDDGLGFTKATNEGIKAARGDLIVLLNNDTQILDKGLPKGTWIKMLEEPFLRDDKVGITGPLQLHDNYADANVMIFFCVMIRKEVFDRIGLLDESFSPGGGEDIAFCIEAEKAGFKQIVVPDNNLTFTFTNEGRFPIYHIGEGTFSNKEFPEYGKRIVKENGFKNMIKYNQHIRLNLGSGGVEIPGYISVDKFDERASVVMDVLDLKLPENSVEELIASHLFEHINPYHSVDVLKNWHRILKPSGKLVMELPNIEELCKEFLKTDKGGRYGVLNCIYGSVNTSTADDPSKITAPHLFGWNIEILKDHLEWAGFTEIVFGPEQIPHPLSHCNMRVEARKPPV
jgi:GT2 family glycosyltransferase